MTALEARRANLIEDPAAGIEISLVAPMFNEEQAIPPFLERVVPIVEELSSSYEIVCVNDGSSDTTLAMLVAARQANPAIKIVDLTRNFGKDIALTAGINHARGRAVIPIDADLQDPPEVITEMVQRWREGYDVVLAARKDRASDSALKRWSARMFYRTIGRISDTPIPENVGDFRLMSRAVVEAVRQLPERTRFMKGILSWVGYRHTTVYYTRPTRVAGTTKWRFWPLWNFALDGIVSFSTLPLKLWSYLGIVCAGFALLYMIYIVIKTLLLGADVPGYASLITVSLFFNGLVLTGMGVIGEYLSRVFIEVKGRPLYLVRERWGVEDDAGSDPDRNT
ncbi:MAG: glycosyltransferase family 2 protein [Pseudomonadota bacterium]